MKYCARCLYPENAKPTIIFDDEGVCSGCRYHESRMKLEVDWDERLGMLEQILEEAKFMARKRCNSHDCIVPVSGGKDSHYQVWLLKKKYGMNPLLVTFNHTYNTPAGNRNLYNLVEKSGCDLVRFTAGLDSVRKISRYMLKTVGDLTWHYHAGIRTYPFQVAVERNIPLIVWGEHGFAELTGIVSLEDFVEFTRWTRKEHDMRGYEPHDLIGKEGISEQDIAPYIYPSDEDIARVEVRGIYLSNFVYWNANKQAEIMMKEWDFAPITFERERTFNLHSKIEDHANDVHDYLKYLKFGYGRATDDASMEIRHGRMTREEGMVMVKRFDSHEPSTLQTYCDFLGITKQQFYDWVEPMRDEKLWKKNAVGKWEPQDAIFLHEIGDLEKKARVKLSEESTFSEVNRRMYYNPLNPPPKTGERALDESSLSFRVI
ncbi:N-acetyl sugar amidotransferase [Candidatus Methylopumilus universalis]|uniref:N-acetyl sugar amidotransferase n=1 Tax=Candidatus Methylopumilus universalis TaxID=2588536 RepID=UPI00112024A6|nr:N-acetyl sugar amidotransferase [Candidatus Methylopumilus universalis]QDC47512.1 N-acetyl sugar amidotransferase [Candidatus Methylopumilus universalis]QDC72045.1 N-acetyl sugar amidotransferase [Candidatus Methylopumilus universalis]